MKKVGILGGGQLGKMLFEAWHTKKNADFSAVSLHFLDNDANAPCSYFGYEVFEKGNITDEQAVYDFGKKMDIISIEIENVNIQALFRLEQEGKKVFPQPHIIALIQDKGTQKEFYQKNNILTAPFFFVKNNQEAKTFFENNPEKSPQKNIKNYVQKLRTGGYDGKGVQLLKKFEDLENPIFDHACVLEQKVNIKKEIAIIVARNPQGQISAFPAVEMVFDEALNLVDYLQSPADISPNIAQKAQVIAKNIIQKLEMVGILAVEMFLDQEDNILVNEIAPRPHNSGHQTIEGNHTSQYIQHLNAILGFSLGDTHIIQPSAMVNIIGEKGHEGEVFYENLEKITAQPDVFVHLYNKKITKAGRKMGHVTILETDKNMLYQKIQFVKNNLKAKTKE